MKDKDLMKMLLQDGWVLVRVNGSHHVLQKGLKTEVVPIQGIAGKNNEKDRAEIDRLFIGEKGDKNVIRISGCFS